MTVPATPTSAAGRARVVVENTARHLIVPAANFVLSYLVITFASDAVWGDFVVHLVVVNLATHLLSWGNKEYLLRAFASEPDAVASLWQSSLVTRGSLLVLAVAVVVGLGYRGGSLAWILLWLLLALIYQSLDVVVLFDHRYRLALAAEVAALAVTVALLLRAGTDLDAMAVVRAWVLGLAVKTAVACLGLAGRLLATLAPRLAPRHLVAAGPFFLIGLSGLLQSRVDLWVVALFLPRAEVGRYQVTISLFIAVQSLAAFALMPFVRDLYRSDDGVSRRLASWLAAAGGVLAMVSGVASWLVLNRLYAFDLGWEVFLTGALTVPPIFRSLPLIYLLYKHGRERRVMTVNFVGAGVNLVLTLVLLPLYGLVGALVAAAAAQWVMLVCFERSAAAGRDHAAALS